MGIAETIKLLGGLGFFLFGMTLLGDGLKRLAGSKLEMILAKLTSTTFKGVLLGTFVTAVIQSSSATTIMVVGFVNSGIMKLGSAIGIIMGANIGTTATGWLLVLAGVEGGGLFSSATMFSLVAFIGIILYFFCKKPGKKNAGLIMLAFAVLMSGMQTMSGAMDGLKESQAFLDFISAVSNPLFAIFVGIIATAIIQSCSASIGILQALSVTGVISYEVAVPMVVGMCIGACVPVLLSAIGANINGKRASLIYLLFNLSGAVVLMVPFYILNAIIHFDFLSTMAVSSGIAVVNTVFKVLAVLILAPIAPLFQKAVVALVKEKQDEDAEEFEENPLDERLLGLPALALEQSGKVMGQMSSTAFKNLYRSIELLENFDQEQFDKIMKREDMVDRYEDKLGAYLVRLHARELSEKETQISACYLTCLTNVERISDHAVNLAELAQELNDKRIAFSPMAAADFAVCAEAVREIAQLTQDALLGSNMASARRVEPLEDVIDLLTKELKSGHVQRVQAGQCTLELGFVFNDCVNNFERVADHCSNIAIAILESADSHITPHDYLLTLGQEDHGDYRRQRDDYARKYCAALSSSEE